MYLKRAVDLLGAYVDLIGRRASLGGSVSASLLWILAPCLIGHRVIEYLPLVGEPLSVWWEGSRCLHSCEMKLLTGMGHS